MEFKRNIHQMACRNTMELALQCSAVQGSLPVSMYACVGNIQKTVKTNGHKLQLSYSTGGNQTNPWPVVAWAGALFSESLAPLTAKEESIATHQKKAEQKQIQNSKLHQAAPGKLKSNPTIPPPTYFHPSPSPLFLSRTSRATAFLKAISSPAAASATQKASLSPSAALLALAALPGPILLP